MSIVTLSRIQSLVVNTTDGRSYHCSDLFIDDRDWTVRYLVLEKHRWSPVGEKRLISPVLVSEVDLDQNRLGLRVNNERLKQQSRENQYLKPVYAQKKHAIFQSYGYGRYWMAKGLGGTYPHSKNESLTNPEGSYEKESPDRVKHLRSMGEMVGYQVSGGQNAYGKAKTFLCDTERWEVSHCLTQEGLLHHKRWAIPTSQIRDVNWNRHALRLSAEPR